MPIAVLGEDSEVSQSALEAQVMADVPDSSEKWPELVGHQTPRLSNYPTFFTSMAGCCRITSGGMRLLTR